jgi:putative ABC transport system substrate-binding protein
MGDPVEDGYVASLSHPGTNLTGLSLLASETDAKRLELVKEAIGRLKHLGLLVDASDPPTIKYVEPFRAASRRVGVDVRAYPFHNLDQLLSVLKAIDRDAPQAVMVWGSSLLTLHRDRVFGTIGVRVPIIADAREYAESGALLSYAPDWRELYRQSATYVDKILKGAKAEDLPIEQPSKFELIVNVRTARALHMTVPESVLLRADTILK